MDFHAFPSSILIPTREAFPSLPTCQSFSGALGVGPWKYACLQVGANSSCVWVSQGFYFLILSHTHPFAIHWCCMYWLSHLPLSCYCVLLAVRHSVQLSLHGRRRSWSFLDFKLLSCPVTSAFWKLWFYSLSHFSALLEWEQYSFHFSLSEVEVEISFL